jgi:hypothetical protein
VPLKVSELEFDEGNEAEMARHAVAAVEVVQVLDGEPVFFRNMGRHAAQIPMVGPTYGGRFLTVPLARTAVEGRWRPATAWDADQNEQLRYTAQRPKK